MKFKGIWAATGEWSKLLVFFSIVMFFWVALTVLGYLFVWGYYGINIADASALSNFKDPAVLRALEVLQIISQEFGFTIVPALFAAYVFDHYPSGYLHLNRKPKLISFLLVVLIMISVIPFINFLVEWNESMKLPSALSGLEAWMQEMEKKAGEITEAFLKMNSFGQMLYKLIILALLPAVGEELMFRGLVQKFFTNITKNFHLGIIISAALFSAIHFQFYGFFPRMFLGMLFGYMLVWSGSLYLPILAHFLNNGMAVVFTYLSQQNKLSFDQDKIGAQQGDTLLLAASIVITLTLLILLNRRSNETM